MPLFDQGISALVEDIYARGLDRDVTVVVWGEFGRTPKINKDAGRDHWSRVNGALLAGGGMKTGQVIGSTDATAAEAKDTPIHYHDVLATVYHNLGIDPHAHGPRRVRPAVADPAEHGAADREGVLVHEAREIHGRAAPPGRISLPRRRKRIAERCQPRRPVGERVVSCLEVCHTVVCIIVNDP